MGNNNSEGGFVMAVVMVVMALAVLGMILVVAFPGSEVTQILQSACAASGC